MSRAALADKFVDSHATRPYENHDASWGDDTVDARAALEIWNHLHVSAWNIRAQALEGAEQSCARMVRESDNVEVQWLI